MSKKLKETVHKAPHGGVKGVADMMRVLDPATRERIMKEVSEKDPSLAQAIQKSMHAFEDVLQADVLVLSPFFKQVPLRTWALALRGLEEAKTSMFFAKFPKRTADLLREEILQLGPQKRTDIQQAQESISILFDTFKDKSP